jgi:hypothetical protein
MFILVNGCSHSSLHPHDSYYALISHALDKNFDNQYIRHQFVTTHLFGGKSDESNPIVCEDDPFFLDKKQITLSLAYPGKSNDTIFSETYESLHYLKKVNKLPDYVFVQWSGPNRRAHILPNDEWTDINPHRLPELQVKFEPMASLQTLQYMLTLQDFLKSNNIEYYFLNYMELDRSIEKLHSYQHLDFSRIIGLENLHPLFDGFRNEMRSRNWVIDYHGHPNTNAHYHIAQLILEKIGKLNDIPNFNEFYENTDLNDLGSYDFTEIKKKGLLHKIGDAEKEIDELEDKFI